MQVRQPHKNLFRLFLHKLGATKTAAMCLAPTQRYLDRATLRITGGRTTLTGWLAGVPTVMLTTVGAKSGRTRTAPLLAIEDDQRPGVIAVVASNYGQSHDPGLVLQPEAHARATGLIRDSDNRLHRP